jgi:import receptor subunit TOM70
MGGSEEEEEKEGDVRINGDDKSAASGFLLARRLLRAGDYDGIVDACTAEVDSAGDYSREAKVLRGTFFILSKQQSKAFADLEDVIADESADPKLRVNALIKRASLFIQQCKDPMRDPDLSFADFKRAEELDPMNTDIYHHRGQVHLLTDQVDRAIADFSKAVELNPGFAIAHVQKLYTDYRKASLEQSAVKVGNVVNAFEDALERFPKCVETYALFAQVGRRHLLTKTLLLLLLQSLAQVGPVAQQKTFICSFGVWLKSCHLSTSQLFLILDT